MNESILDDSAVSEIEARLHLTTDGDACFVLSNVRALCATVKHLRAELATTKGHWADTSEDLASTLLKRESLQSQLEELRAEVERLQGERDGMDAAITPLADRLAEVEQGRDAMRDTLNALKTCQNKPVCGHCSALLRQYQGEV